MTTTALLELIAPEGRGLSLLLHLVEAEYREMPCLSLTKRQMQRLWGIDSSVCEALIDAPAACSERRRTGCT